MIPAEGENFHGEEPIGRSNAEEWRQVRTTLNQHRHALAGQAVELYPALPRVASTPLLCRPEWVPDRPLPLDSVDLRWTAGAARASVTGKEPESAGVRPGFAAYSAAMAELAAPSVFEDRACYRLLAADLRGPAMLRFGTAGYFAGLDVKEALAHELAAAVPGLPFRALVGDPCDLSRHTAVPAITTVTVRHDRRTGAAEFLLHWRDPDKVAHGGGLYQVMPVGVFQPVTGGAAVGRRDLDLWRCMSREFSEELLGTGEDYGTGFRYESWPFFRHLDDARRAGLLTVHCLGLGVDPLSLAVDILTVAVFDAEVFDRLFHALVPANAEGIVRRIDLAEAEPFVTGKSPMQAAGAAALALVLEHRTGLLP